MIYFLIRGIRGSTASWRFMSCVVFLASLAQETTPAGTLRSRLACGLDQQTSSDGRPEVSEAGYFAALPQLGHGSQHEGAGQQTVTGTCLHTQRGMQRVTV